MYNQTASTTYNFFKHQQIITIIIFKTDVNKMSWFGKKSKFTVKTEVGMVLLVNTGSKQIQIQIQI